MRTAGAGCVTLNAAGREVRVAGWVHRRRDLGGLVFIDLRDRSGILQVSAGPGWSSPEALETVRGLGPEDVISVRGVVTPRPEAARNPDMATGDVEVQASELEVLNRARTPEIPVYLPPEEELPSEKLRLRHRVLDLRRRGLQSRLALRHRLMLAVRNYFDSQGFLEIETPILTKPTPEGARDFLVPSRVHRGEFFALPQSPQIYKQLLMIAGFDRYMQIARCFRDEDLRADRQPEFTQIDVEASFVEPEDIYGWCEGLMGELAKVAGIDAPTPFPRLTYHDAMERFGCDRPDLRYDLEIRDFTAVLGELESNILRGAVASGGRIRGFGLAGGARLSRKQILGLEAAAKAGGAPGLLWGKITEDGATGPLGRFFLDDTRARLDLAAGDLLVAAAGPDRTTSPALDATRGAAIEALALPRTTEHAWLWVTGFPVFEETGDGSLAANHHPFVQPHPQDAHLLDSEPLAVRGLAYDLVYNGTELGSGSVRMHDAALQTRILAMLGLEPDEITAKFGFLIRALGSGAPPHGGIALGVDRLVSCFSGGGSLRDVIAFPKTTAARASFEGAPSPVVEAELAALGLSLEQEK
ncbi:MAG: aspartate--tRNA ligase [Gemmatimonadetes bacterium]|nr:aspartate--tRNA ligase [Gemmatimonadota bacterium]MYH54514.1 aspartate--tRNA ligase [Gemmatimonadota bacterium]MYK67965.1 aspartate--tRNA ligase [Gemmatimonadota bacterium]